MKRVLLSAAFTISIPALAGCRSTALSFAADAVAHSGTSYASDDDPELVRGAVPFGLKTMEGLLEEKPKHRGLLTALAGGFTQYAYAFVQTDSDLADLDGKLDSQRARRARAGAAALPARARVRTARTRRRLQGARGPAAGRPGRRAGGARRGRQGGRAAPYWTASAWALAIAASKGDMSLVAELPVPVAMMERALELDEAWNDGAIHEFFVVYDATRSAAEGGGPDRARAHLERVGALSMNKKLGPRVSWAEGVLVQRQDRDEFTRVLEEVLRADPGEVRRFRLANILAQRRAKALLAHTDDLFL
jgi:predicted anti-sigma-YlaC factor YlaD